ncbi:hypothetical protein GCM10009802_04930 [Streptomyces synnematoformans]|uniref:Uncharacterized protein n=1 Tax=Streptomyces synnematoformans TaxID=415721 RepID=A0ABP5J130_9ACTN
MSTPYAAVRPGVSRTPGRPAQPRRRRPRPCNVPTGPHALNYARTFPCGPRCSTHSPAAVAGKPEPTPGPGIPAYRTEARP